MNTPQVKFPSLPKLTLKEPYKRRPLNEHSMLTKGAIHIPNLMKDSSIVHPASSVMTQHIANGYFKNE